jgi:hypothetical protein
VFCGTLSAQQNFSEIDKHAKSAPPLVSSMYKPLTHYLCDRYSSDEEKVRAISVWIINNIRYNTRMYVSDNRKKHSPNKILRKKKAICQGYSDLFLAMCTEAGINAKTIEGYDKGAAYEPGDIFVREDHCWNAVELNDGWHLIDLTWCAGQLVPKQQYFRRFLFYAFNIPFKQKYKFNANANYHYYLTPPEEFAKDHLPVYPWWQLNSPQISIDTFEKDSTQPDTTFFTRGYFPAASVSLPDIAESTEPVAYLKRGKAAHEFNKKNFRNLAENKALYGWHWFVQSKKKKDSEIENKERYEIYDSCKTVFEEAGDAMKQYIKWSAKERSLRKLKNKEWKEKWQNANKVEIRNNRAVIQKNYRRIENLEKEIAGLREIKGNLHKEADQLSNRKTKNGKITIRSASELEPALKSMIGRPDSITAKACLLYNESDRLLQKTDTVALFITDTINAIQSVIYNKMIVRFFFEWHYKHVLDSLQLTHAKYTDRKDSLIRAMEDIIADSKIKFSENLNTVANARNIYSARLQFFEELYLHSEDSLREGRLNDSIRKSKKEWEEYDEMRADEIDNRISMLRNEKRKLNNINRHLRQESMYNRYEIYIEGKRFRHFNKQYLRFYLREKKKAVKYLKDLKSIRIYVRKEMTAVKEKIREEEKQEREDAKKASQDNL